MEGVGTETGRTGRTDLNTDTPPRVCPTPSHAFCRKRHFGFDAVLKQLVVTAPSSHREMSSADIASVPVLCMGE